jgi:hypothetical protein
MVEMGAIGVMDSLCLMHELEKNITNVITEILKKKSIPHPHTFPVRGSV